MTYGIANKKTMILAQFANTTDSIYPVVSFKIFRKFSTRNAARAYKRSLKNPQYYAIINTSKALVVR